MPERSDGNPSGSCLRPANCTVTPGVVRGQLRHSPARRARALLSPFAGELDTVVPKYSARLCRTATETPCDVPLQGREHGCGDADVAGHLLQRLACGMSQTAQFPPTCRSPLSSVGVAEPFSSSVKAAFSLQSLPDRCGLRPAFRAEPGNALQPGEIGICYIVYAPSPNAPARTRPCVSQSLSVEAGHAR